MNWFEMINDATDYIEKHITEDIDLKDIAKKCNVSYSYFAKIFPMITGYSLKEYIRNRRMTMASYEVTNTDYKIIDIAIKFGYGSNEAFSRAFKAIHGVNPSIARKNEVNTFIHFPMIHYDITTSDIRDLSYEIIHPTSYRFVGRTIHIKEHEDVYQTRRELDSFVQDFCDEVGYVNHYSGEHIIYKVKYNIDPVHREYDVIIGFDASKVTLSDDYESVSLYHDRFVQYTAIGESTESIRTLKTTIYEEWLDIHFEFEPICEIEYIRETEDFDYFLMYTVSIQ